MYGLLDSQKAKIKELVKSKRKVALELQRAGKLLQSAELMQEVAFLEEKLFHL